MIKKIVIFIILLFPVSGFCADHYASPTGSASWANSTNINTPTDDHTAFANAAAGDTVYFRGGTYTVPFTGYSFEKSELNPANSGTSGNPIVFKAYTGETPVFNCTGLPTWSAGDYSGTQVCRVMGIIDDDYITFDGLHLQTHGGERVAELALYGGSNIIVQNMDIDGGSLDCSTDSNSQLIRIESLNTVTIHNNTLHDNANATTTEDDVCAIKGYHNDNGTISNNNITDCTNGIDLKSDNDSFDVYNNFISGVTRAGIRAISTSGMESSQLNIYNNLIIGFVGSVAAGMDGDYGEDNPCDDWHIYNNTFYSSGSAKLGIHLPPTDSGLRVYNNIIFTTTITDTLRTRSNTVLDQFDHNQWGHLQFNNHVELYTGEATYTSLAAWQSSGELGANYDAGCGSNQNPGCGSLASDPQFVNTSGNMNEIADFALDTGSPCIGTGRSGADMGADVTLVGVASISGSDAIQGMQISYQHEYRRIENLKSFYKEAA